jgi:prolipoprotein diacylglyceryltransferase
MYPILFTIPLSSLWERLPDIPIHSYGAMLFVAFICCTSLAAWLARPYGIPRHVFQDLAIWLFAFGILGGRLAYVIKYPGDFETFGQVFAIWSGGLIVYGAFFGGALGFLIAYRLFLHKYNLGVWQFTDVIAPCVALGMCLGRIGCLLNGCCYGNIACDSCPSVHFPITAAPSRDMVKRGHQTSAGFTVNADGSTTVSAVEPGSPAAAAGLQSGDTIVKINGRELRGYRDLENAFREIPRDRAVLDLEVQRGEQNRALPAFRPRSLGLHPTQLYETISMILLLFFLLAYYPYRTHDGSVLVLFLFGYSLHRFVNEMLRTDTEKVAFDMTLSQNISILVAALGVVLAILVWRRPRRAALPA